MKKFNENHPGWLTHMHGGKDHYYFSDEGDFILSLCGEIKDNGYMDLQPVEDESNLCKRCLAKVKKLENGEKIEIKMKGFLI